MECIQLKLVWINTLNSVQSLPEISPLEIVIMKYLCQRQHLLSISICWIVWKLFDHINQIQISDKEHSHLGHEMYFTTIGEKCRIWLSAVSVFSSFSYLAVSRWSIKFRWGKFCFYNIIIHILRVRLRDIPASAGLSCSRLVAVVAVQGLTVSQLATPASCQWLSVQLEMSMRPSDLRQQQTPAQTLSQWHTDLSTAY